jgi:DNA (cytosine-5)-methyltransferase 1
LVAVIERLVSPAATALPTSLELFAGAGGLALGLQRAGFEARMMVDYDARAVSTLRANGREDGPIRANWPVEQADVRTLSFHEFRGVDLVSAGPPCQPFSIGGLRKGRHDDRDLMPEAIRAIRESKPNVFVIENVRGLTFPAVRPYLDYCVAQLRNPSIVLSDEDEPGHSRELARIPEREHEYRVDWRLLNAADYGLPQQRVRLLIVGVRCDFPDWSWPPQTHSRARLVAALAGDAYWDAHEVDRATRAHARRVLRGAKAALRGAPESGAHPWRTVRDAFALLGSPHPSHLDPHHRVVEGARLYRKHRGSPLDWPAKTVKAGVHGTPGGEHIVILDDGSPRYFTVRECAILQGFPQSYVLPGLRSVALRQLGNAVPVGLAEALGRSLASVLTRSKETSR